MDRRAMLSILALGALGACGTARPSVAPAATAAPASLAPELTGGGAWLNSQPLSLAGLRGNVVAVDFWTYGCINCTRTIPYLQGYWEQFKDQGLVIIGVHTPEFQHEHELANVQAAVERLGVRWPVVQDNDYQIWQAYHNRYWPHLYLIDKQGSVVFDHIGEGAYDEIERQIAAALQR
jgi:thiol-disulfide isomerase/thioredoxin